MLDSLAENWFELMLGGLALGNVDWVSALWLPTKRECGLVGQKEKTSKYRIRSFRASHWIGLLSQIAGLQSKLARSGCISERKKNVECMSILMREMLLLIL
ncbi:hypothetical protein RRG08_025656 [Elysia crispata]|uniref:Uncharacterized protein n=1 Tax=Elysia crispata TaxID=231223 RepID=A0AAE0YFA8_9GAST|nr:hypothetical protein RRG08_025656 [Elysia crispata]